MPRVNVLALVQDHFRLRIGIDELRCERSTRKVGDGSAMTKYLVEFVCGDARGRMGPTVGILGPEILPSEKSDPGLRIVASYVPA